MKRLGIVFGVLLLPSVAFAQALAPSCDDQLALSNQLVQDFNQQRTQLQIENASLKVQVGRLQKDAQDAKAKVEPAKKDKK